jgi:hypothetical protein
MTSNTGLEDNLEIGRAFKHDARGESWTCARVRVVRRQASCSLARASARESKLLNDILHSPSASTRRLASLFRFCTTLWPLTSHILPRDDNYCAASWPPKAHGCAERRTFPRAVTRGEHRRRMPSGQHLDSSHRSPAVASGDNGAFEHVLVSKTRP